MRYIAIIVLALALAACGVGSSSSHPPAAPAQASSTPASSPAGQTSAQGAMICQDLAKWIPQADNGTTPRFTDQLETDETDASGSQLGDNMTTLTRACRHSTAML